VKELALNITTYRRGAAGQDHMHGISGPVFTLVTRDSSENQRHKETTFCAPHHPKKKNGWGEKTFSGRSRAMVQKMGTSDLVKQRSTAGRKDLGGTEKLTEERIGHSYCQIILPSWCPKQKWGREGE